MRLLLVLLEQVVMVVETKLELNPQHIMVVVFRVRSPVDTKVVEVVAVATTVVVAVPVVMVPLVEVVDQVGITLDLTGQALHPLLQEMVEHLVVHPIQIIRVEQLVVLQQDQEMMEDMVQYMLILQYQQHNMII